MVVAIDHNYDWMPLFFKTLYTLVLSKDYKRENAFWSGVWSSGFSRPQEIGLTLLFSSAHYLINMTDYCKVIVIERGRECEGGGRGGAACGGWDDTRKQIVQGT